MIRNQRGLTLLEVLATITILSIAGIIIWQVFLQGHQYSQKAISKNLMIQETNIINSNLLKIHQIYDQYELTSTDSNCGVAIQYEGNTDVYTHPKICISFEPNDIIPGIVKPNLEDVPLKLTANDKNDSENRISIETILYRMKGGNY